MELMYNGALFVTHKKLCEKLCLLCGNVPMKVLCFRNHGRVREAMFAMRQCADEKVLCFRNHGRVREAMFAMRQCTDEKLFREYVNSKIFIGTLPHSILFVVFFRIEFYV
jgi:hypothetical protein